MEYSARLSFLCLHSLERRRLTANLILIQRIIFALVKVNMADYMYFLLKMTALQLVVIPISCL